MTSAVGRFCEFNVAGFFESSGTGWNAEYFNIFVGNLF